MDSTTSASLQPYTNAMTKPPTAVTRFWKSSPSWSPCTAIDVDDTVAQPGTGSVLRLVCGQINLGGGGRHQPHSRRAQVETVEEGEPNER